jgi:hypothetical protein
MARAIEGELVSAAKAAAQDGEFRLSVLDEGSEVAEAMRVNLSTGETISPSLLERVPMPTGGSTTWSFTVNGNDISTKEIVGVPVYFAPRLTLWPTDEPSGKSPVLVANDLMTAHRVSEEIGDLDPAVLEAARIGDKTYSLQKLWYAQWGSGRNGKGKRMRESRIICILRETDAWPLLIQCGAMSVGPLSEFFVRLSVPYYQSVIGLSLTKEQNAAGQPYARVKPRQIAKLTREQGQRLNATYTAALTRMMQSVGAGGASGAEFAG